MKLSKIKKKGDWENDTEKDRREKTRNRSEEKRTRGRKKRCERREVLKKGRE